MANDANDTHELLRCVQAGDEQALTTLFTHYRDRLRWMVRLRLDRRLQGWVDPPDVFQGADLDVAQRAPGGRAWSSFSPSCPSGGATEKRVRRIGGRPPRLRAWRTRKGPFAGVWPELLLWLQEDPGATAKSLRERLHQKYRGRFPEGQLRTLQRRLREWRRVMARQLVYTCLSGTETGAKPVVIGADGSAGLERRSGVDTAPELVGDG
jgi:hypothetical protein